MTVASRLKALEAKRAQIRATPCVSCGHPWNDHYPHDRCWSPRVPTGDRPACKCRQFVDPDETIS